MNAKINEAFSTTDEYDYLNTLTKPSTTTSNRQHQNQNQNNKQSNKALASNLKNENINSNKNAISTSSFTLVKLTREQIEKEFYEYTLECRRRLDQLFTNATTTSTDASTTSRSSTAISQPLNVNMLAKKTHSSNTTFDTSKSNTLPSKNNNFINFGATSGNYKLFKVMPPTMSIRDVESSKIMSNRSRQSNHYTQPSIMTSTLNRGQHQQQHQTRHRRDVEDESPNRLYKSFKRPTVEKIWHI